MDALELTNATEFSLRPMFDQTSSGTVTPVTGPKLGVGDRTMKSCPIKVCVEASLCLYLDMIVANGSTVNLLTNPMPRRPARISKLMLDSLDGVIKNYNLDDTKEESGL